MVKRILFQGNGHDAKKHIKDCKIKECKTCETLKEFLERCEEDKLKENLE